MSLKKDEILDRLAKQGSVAQFIAFRSAGEVAPVLSYARILGHSDDKHFKSIDEAVAALLTRAKDGSVNVRSYAPDSPRSQEFIYGLSNVSEIVAAVTRLSASGLNTIVNETIDIHDGGVSGVAQGGVIEFSPDDTPRCVEKPGTASLPLDLGQRMLATVYGFSAELPKGVGRAEFSIHPEPRGTRQTHTLLWEYEENAPNPVAATMHWPNRFSRHIGDKAFGLLMAWLLGQRVPYTTVISRRVAPFSFGETTGSLEHWTRTCPIEPEPGFFTTVRGWTDPFALLAKEDPSGMRISSVLAQQAVNVYYAGAAIMGGKELVIEGKSGEGDRFMLGEAPPEVLPASVVTDVQKVYDSISTTLGPVRFEWAHDGDKVWVLQLHRGATQSQGHILVPGDAAEWFNFNVSAGLEALRTLVQELPPGIGIELEGQVGLTSHIADVVRRAYRPTRVKPS